MYNEGIVLFEECYGRYLAPGVLARRVEEMNAWLKWLG
jgi:hypothetical protein